MTEDRSLASVLRAQAAYDPAAVRLRHSPGMADWLLRHRLSLAFTSYQTGRLILAGVAPDGRLFFNEQNYTRAMGVHFANGTLHVASLYQIWRLTNMLEWGEFANRAFDCVLVPRTSHVTGYVDTHELAVDGNGRLLFVNSRYSCIATIDSESSFRVLWQPPFISELKAEDRCHLNGMAMADGKLRYVTALSATDTESGWRANRQAGGILIEVDTGTIISDQLSMPHSPRLAGEELWVLNSGTGHLAKVDRRSGAVSDVVFCPGFLRGMAIHDDHAIVAVSRPRGSSSELPLQAELDRRKLGSWCGLLVIDLRKAAVVEFIRYETQIDELFDVTVLPGIRNPMSIGPSTEEILNAIRFGRPSDRAAAL